MTNSKILLTGLMIALLLTGFGWLALGGEACRAVFLCFALSALAVGGLTSVRGVVR